MQLKMGHPLPSIPPATKNQASQVSGFNKLGVSLAYPKVAHPHSPWQWLLSPMTTTPKPPRWASLKFNRPKTHNRRNNSGLLRKLRFGPPKPCGSSVFQKINPIQTKQDETSCFFVLGNPCLWVRHHNYTLENQHGTQKWRFGR